MSAEDGIRKAKERYNYILSKKERKASRQSSDPAAGGSPSLNPSEEQVNELASDFPPVPPPPPSPLTGPLKTLLSRTFNVMASSQTNAGGQKTIRLPALVDFGRFLGLEWASDVTALKSELLTLGVANHSTHMEFKSVNKVDRGMFVAFVNGKVNGRSMEYGSLLEMVEGFLAYKTATETKRELLNSAVIITREQATLEKVDYLHLYHLGRCLRKGFTWDDCNVVKIKMLRADDDEKVREKVLLGCMASAVEDRTDEAVRSGVHDFMAVVEELEGGKGIVGQDAEILHSSDRTRRGHNDDEEREEATKEEPRAAQASDQSDISFVSVARSSASTSNLSSRIPKPSAKASHFVRAAFRAMPKTPTSSLEPKVVKHFGQYLGFDWALTYQDESNGYVLDGDLAGGEVTEQEFLTFCGRRIGGMEDRRLGQMGKGYLAAVRGSQFRRRIIDGALRVLLCSETGGVELEEMLHLAKCVTPRYTVEESQQAHGLVRGYDHNKNVRRSVFEGIFSSILLKYGVSDAAFTAAVERFVESVGLEKLGENARSSRKASIALLKMDIVGEGAPQPDEFRPETTDFSFVAPTEISSTFSQNAVANNTSIKGDIGGGGNGGNFLQDVSFISNLTAPAGNSFRSVTNEPVEENAIHDLHEFITKAKQAKESAHNMKIRDQRIKQGYLSTQDREELFGEERNFVLGGGEEAEVEKEELGWGKREKKKPYKRYATPDAAKPATFRKKFAATVVLGASRTFSNTLLNRTAATVIQAWARRWLAQSMYIFWVACCRVQRRWRGVQARMAVKVLKKFRRLGGAGGGSGKKGKKQRTKAQGDDSGAVSASDFNGISSPSANAGQNNLNELNNLLLSLALSQSQGATSNGSNNLQQQQLLSLLHSQQQQHQMVQQPMQQTVQQPLQPYPSPYPPPAPFYQPQQSSQDEVNLLRDELEKMERRMRQVEDDKEREMSELVKFKEAASAHLRAQNMTIKRLTAKRDVGTVAQPVHERIMDRVRKGASPPKQERRVARTKARSAPFNYSTQNHY